MLMSRVGITLATAPYARTQAMRDGTVQVEGVDLNYLTMSVEEVFWRQLKHQEFEAAEMSLSSYLIARDRGFPEMIAIPVFPFRLFRHSAIYYHKGSNIARPEDLKGKIVGVPEYEITASVWARGILQHEYGVFPEEIRWRSGGEEQPGRKDKSRLELPPGVELQPIPADRTLDAMLAAGEIDALIAARMPPSYVRGDERVARLFPDYRAVEEAYFQKTGIFPIMHTVVLRRDVYEAHPWVAKSLQKAFLAAKSIAEEGLFKGLIEHIAMPWMLADMEAELRVLGRENFWPYGLGPMNRRTLEAFLDYSFEQGLVKRRFQLEEIFAPNTADDFRV